MTAFNEKNLSEFAMIYEAVMKLLTVLKTHECAPPGIKGVMVDLESVCEDPLLLYKEISSRPASEGNPSP